MEKFFRAFSNYQVNLLFGGIKEKRAKKYETSSLRAYFLAMLTFAYLHITHVYRVMTNPLGTPPPLTEMKRNQSFRF